MRQRPLLVALAAALLVLPAVPAERRTTSGPVEVTALAVSETAQGFVGTAARVEATVLASGSGQVFVATKPLAATDMQGSARLAARVAAATLGLEWSRFDYLVTFRSDSSVIGGPSAGAVMTLALTAALHNLVDPGHPWSLDPAVAGTGTINPDGTIGPVGGIPAKAEAAAAAGVQTFLYPAGLDQAPTLVAGDFGPRQVVVDMASHCAGLFLECRPAASIREVVEAAAGVRLERLAAPLPATLDYADVLGPAVEREVDRLAARVAALEADARPGAFGPAEAQLRAGELEGARTRLREAEEGVAAGQYYHAATRAFQGSLSAGRAENVTAFYAAGRAEAVVTAALASCGAAVREARAVTDGLAATGFQHLHAVAAAQVRSADAAEVQARAQAEYASAVRFDDWVQAMYDAAFCSERARSALFWAGLRDAFGPGPPLGDGAAVAQDAIDQASDLVAYADAVLQGGAGDARARLEAAGAEMAAGRHPGALLFAVEAQTQASVALQTATGAAVPAAVLDAAREAASRAVADARARGVEPLLSVSLVELSQTQSDPAAALQNLWTARSTALLDDVESPPEMVGGPEPAGQGVGAAGGGYVAAAAAAGLLVGAALVAVAWGLAARR